MNVKKKSSKKILVSKKVLKKTKPKRKVVSVRKLWGELNEEGNKVYELHAGQSKVLKSNARFIAAIAGTGGGKTVLGPLWIAKRIKQLIKDGVKPPYIGMVIAPTYKVLSRATSPTLVETFRGTDLEGTFLETKGQYVLPYGMGRIYLLSADSPDGLEGGQLNIGAWLDEAGQMSQKAWQAICRRTGVNEAPIFITTTPYLVNWLKVEVFDNYLQGDKDYFVACWASILNPVYPRKEFERAQKTLSKRAFDMMYRGMFTSSEGLVYPDFPLCIVEEKKEISGMGVGGIDFGWRAPFCALEAKLVIEDGKDVLYVVKERYVKKCTVAEHAKKLNKLVRWYADPSAPESITTLRRNGLAFVIPAKNDIKAGIDAVTERLLTGRLKVMSSCIHLIAEAGLYQYPPEQDAELPEAGLDHAMDALRYMCMALSKNKRQTKSSKISVRKGR